MATITVSEVRDFVPNSLSDASIQMIIDVVDEADACLTTGGYSDAQAKLAKMYGAAAMIVQQSGGQLQSQSSFTGDSVSFDTSKGSGNQYLDLLQGMDAGACVLTAIGQGGTYPLQVQRG